MRDPNPTVILIPGLGMIAWGKDKSESRVTAEFYNCAVEVMRGAEAIDEYIALPQQEAFDIEYWLLEEAKLKRMPPPRRSWRARSIAVVGAGSGIGREAAHAAGATKAHMSSASIVNADGAQATASDDHRPASASASAWPAAASPTAARRSALQADITAARPASGRCSSSVALAYGGLDAWWSRPASSSRPTQPGRIPDEQWAQTFAINVTGLYLVADEAAALWKPQGLPANLVLTTSVNAVVAKKGSLAYDTSKAAANHLVRELAVSLAPLVRVNGVAPATVVQGSADVPARPGDRVAGEVYDPVRRADADDELRTKLAQFYATAR